MFWVKICGIGSYAAAACAAEQGASAVGFILTPGFRRSLAPEAAREIIRRLPPALHKVGVFVDDTPERINALIDSCGLTMVQLHGHEPPEYLHQVRRPAARAIRLQQSADAEQTNRFRTAHMLLLEPYVAGTKGGGLGTSLDPALVHAVRTRLGLSGAGVPGPLLVLAGGLDPENVAEAIAAAAPDGVDVSSGVETDGTKDLSKIAAFIAAARGARV